jgi:PTH1 family peptidyl-tRNA hydrolase
VIKLVVGLGNPGRRYANTRHNVGWMVVDALAERLGCLFEKEEFNGLVARCTTGGRSVYLLKPLTYMNRSGECVGAFASHHEIRPEELMVVYDDLDLPLGVLRLRLKGSSGGHKGVMSVEEALCTQSFPRLRIGIGRPLKKEDVVDFVLSPFTSKELPVIEGALKKAVDCLESIVESGEISNRLISTCTGG